jgi:hypothetical protein
MQMKVPIVLTVILPNPFKGALSICLQTPQPIGSGNFGSIAGLIIQSCSAGRTDHRPHKQARPWSRTLADPTAPTTIQSKPQTLRKTGDRALRYPHSALAVTAVAMSKTVPLLQPRLDPASPVIRG